MGIYPGGVLFEPTAEYEKAVRKDPSLALTPEDARKFGPQCLPQTANMASEKPPVLFHRNMPCEAGIFALSGDGWVILERRKYLNLAAARRWITSRSDVLQARSPEVRIRASAVELTEWINLDTVLADYEARRKANDPDFCIRSAPSPTAAPSAIFTPRQGQFLAFIHAYTKLNGRPPAERDMERYFQVSPPVVHDMILLLEEKKLIQRVPGQPRSIRVLLDPDQLPPLK